MISKHLAIIGVIIGIILILLAGNDISDGDKSFWTIIRMFIGITFFLTCITKIN
tara:strand:+ start:924 stop:1085 length:162 start_codon:yes stop_codon:yes gene_type:complete